MLPRRKEHRSGRSRRRPWTLAPTWIPFRASADTRVRPHSAVDHFESQHTDPIAARVRHRVATRPQSVCEVEAWTWVIQIGLGVEVHAPVSGRARCQLCNGWLWTPTRTLLDLVTVFLRRADRTVSTKLLPSISLGFWCTNRHNPSSVKTLTEDFFECKCLSL